MTNHECNEGVTDGLEINICQCDNKRCQNKWLDRLERIKVVLKIQVFLDVISCVLASSY
jgi:ribosome biogenesis protein Tsr3